MSVVVANPKNANEVSFDTQQRLLEQQKQEEEELRQKARKIRVPDVRDKRGENIWYIS